MFDNFFLALDEELPNARKRALLIHCLRAEGQRLFYTLNPRDQGDDTYSSALSAIKDFFIPKVNVVAERYRFRQRSVRARPQTSMLLHYVNCLPPANSA